MKNYFTLQYKMLNRQLADFGIQPVLAYLALPVIFIVLSIYLFQKTAFAQYIYLLMALSLITRFNDSNRNNFLKACFKSNDYLIIRIAENVLVILPFFIFLICKNYFFSAAILLLLSPFAALVSFKSKLQFTIPTPFYKQPFEFITGFRKTFLGFLCCYSITFIAIAVHNFNLGIFALLLNFLFCISFYTSTEPDFYVWVYSLTPKLFLIKKIKTALLHVTILTFPAAVILSLFYISNSFIIAGFYCLGYVYLAAIVCAKYSVFPVQMGLPQIILLAISIPLPPLLIILVPYFYLQSIKKLGIFLK